MGEVVRDTSFTRQLVKPPEKKKSSRDETLEKLNPDKKNGGQKKNAPVQDHVPKGAHMVRKSVPKVRKRLPMCAQGFQKS